MGMESDVCVATGPRAGDGATAFRSFVEIRGVLGALILSASNLVDHGSDERGGALHDQEQFLR